MGINGVVESPHAGHKVLQLNSRFREECENGCEMVHVWELRMILCDGLIGGPAKSLGWVLLCFGAE